MRCGALRVELPLKKIAAQNSGKNIMRTSAIIIACLIGGLLFALFLFSHSVFIVGSSSMEPSYPLNSVVIVKKSGFESLKAGDVIAYRADALGGSIALHRITRKEDGGFYTKGDANSFEDNQLILEQAYIGKSVYCIKFFAVYFRQIQTLKGLILFFIIPIILIILIYSSLTILKGGQRNETYF